MKKAHLLFLLFLITLHIYPQDNYKKLVDSLKYVEDVPYIHNFNDPVFWRIVSKGLDIVPSLIDKMTDAGEIDSYVPNFGGKYAIADIAYSALEEIIGNIPTFELLGVKFDEKGCGYCSYWFHVRESKKNRKRFQQAVRKWYKQNKESLVWVEGSQSVTGDCFMPGGGHYEVNQDGEILLAQAFIDPLMSYIPGTTAHRVSDIYFLQEGDYWNYYFLSENPERYQQIFCSEMKVCDKSIVKELSEYCKPLLRVDSVLEEVKYKWNAGANIFYQEKYKNVHFVNSEQATILEYKQARIFYVDKPLYTRNKEYALVAITTYTTIGNESNTSQYHHLYRKVNGRWTEVGKYLTIIS